MDLLFDALSVVVQLSDDLMLVSFAFVSQQLREVVMRFCERCAKQGYLELLKWARDLGANWNSNTCTNAARGGHFEVLRWAFENGCQFSQATSVAAAEYGDVEILKYILLQGGFCGQAVQVAAIRAGHKHVLLWLRDYGLIDNLEQLRIQAVASTSMDMFDWFEEHFPLPDKLPTSVLFVHACAANNLELAKRSLGDGVNNLNFWCLSNIAKPEILDFVVSHATNYTPGTEITRSAARKKNFAILEWGHKRNLLTRDVMYEAAGTGSYEVFIYVFERVRDIPVDAWEDAARGGSLKILRFMKAFHEQLGVTIPNVTSWCCSLKVMKFLHEECKMTIENLDLKKAEPELIKWLVKEHGFGNENIFSRILLTDASLLEWLVNFGIAFPRGRVLAKATLDSGRVETLEWAKRHGCRWNLKALKHAISRRDLTVIDWLHRNTELRYPLFCDNVAARQECWPLFWWGVRNGYKWSPSVENLILGESDPRVPRWFLSGRITLEKVTPAEPWPS